MKSSEIQVLIQPSIDIPRGRWRLATSKRRPDGSHFVPIEGTFDPVEILFLQLIVVYLNRYRTEIPNMDILNPLPILQINKTDEADGLYRKVFSIS